MPSPSARHSLKSASVPVPLHRIVHVPRRFTSEQWGGTETLVLNLCIQQRKSGFDPVVLTSRALSSVETDSYDDIPVRRFGYCYPYLGLSDNKKHALDQKGGNLISPSLFLSLLSEGDVRLYHAHALRRLGGMVRTAARMRKKPFVVSLHGSGVDTLPTLYARHNDPAIRGRFDWGKIFGALLGSRKVLNDADMILCVSEWERTQVLSEVNHDRVTVLPHGVDASRFTKGDGEVFREYLHIPADAFMVLNVGRIEAQKNQMLLLEAFLELRKRVPDAHLVLIGPVRQPGYATQLNAYISTHHLRSCVHILPGLTQDDPMLENAYHAADVFVLPSHHESFGGVVLEAWCAGRTVLVNKVGGLSTLVRENETGLFFNAKESNPSRQLAARLVMLADDDVLRDRLGNAGRMEAIARYDWSRINIRLEQLYQQAEANAAKRYGRVKGNHPVPVKRVAYSAGAA